MQLVHALSSPVKLVRQWSLLSLLFMSPVVSAQHLDSLYLQQLFDNGWNLINRQPDSALFLFEKAKVESKNRNYIPGLVMYHNYSASLELSVGRYQEAFAHYDKGIAIAKHYGLRSPLGISYMKKGTLNQFMREYTAAAENYIAAASLLQTNEERKQIIGLYKNILATLTNLQQQNQSLRRILPALRNNNTSEEEIALILTQKKTGEPDLDFPDQTTVREVTGGKTYVIFGGAKFFIADLAILSQYNNYRSVRKIPDGMLSRIPDIPHDGTLLRQLNDGGQVWLIKDKQRHRVESPEVLQYFGGWDALCTVPEHTLDQIPDAGEMVTMQNVNTTFNFRKEYEILIDTLKNTLAQNTWLVDAVGAQLKAKNNILQKRKTLLWTSLVGITGLLYIGFLLLRNSRQKQKMHRQSLLSLKAEQELERKMEVEKERTRIATDMHDDLGAGLTRIKFIAENISERASDPALQPEMEKIKQSSIDLVENMAEIIWAMNEKNNTLEDLLFYLRSYTMDYCTENDLACEFHIPEGIPRKVIGGQVRRNVFLVLKESLHNIVKHAKAKNVCVTVKADDQLLLIVQDDGKGFEQIPGQPGNGIINMEHRAQFLKGKMWVANGEGTAIHLELPL